MTSIVDEDDDISIDNPFFFMPDGEEICDNELALAKLLIDGVCFANGRQYVTGRNVRVNEFDGFVHPETVVLFVNCNDHFGPMADVEELPFSEIPRLYKMHRDYPGWGDVRWCSLRRNQRPWSNRERWMKSHGYWDDEMEALPTGVQRAATQRA